MRDGRNHVNEEEMAIAISKAVKHMNRDFDIGFAIQAQERRERFGFITNTVSIRHDTFGRAFPEIRKEA